MVVIIISVVVICRYVCMGFWRPRMHLDVLKKTKDYYSLDIWQLARHSGTKSLEYNFLSLLFGRYLDTGSTGHLDTGFSWFPWVLEQMLGWFPTVQSCHYMLHM